MIEMNEFLEREAITGQLTINGSSNHVLYPPKNKTEFSGIDRKEKNQMWDYLRQVAACPRWEPFHDYVVIPRSPNSKGNTSSAKILSDKKLWSPLATALPEDHPMRTESDKDRHRREMIFAGGRKGDIYGKAWQKQKVIHFISLPGKVYMYTMIANKYLFSEAIFCNEGLPASHTFLHFYFL